MIYFIQSGESGAIKIGYTASEKTLDNRVIAMQTGSAEPLNVIGTIDGTRSDEHDIYKKFHVYQIHGEWFIPDPILIKFIRNLCRIIDNPLKGIDYSLELLEKKGIDVFLREVETNFIKLALSSSKTKTHAARRLKLTYRQLHYRMNAYKM